MDEGSPNPTSPIFLHAQRNLFSIIDPTNFSPIQNSNLPTPGVCLSAKESIQFHLPFHLKADGSLLWRNRTNCENLLFSRFSISTAAPGRTGSLSPGMLGDYFFLRSISLQLEGTSKMKPNPGRVCDGMNETFPFKRNCGIEFVPSNCRWISSNTIEQPAEAKSSNKW